MNTLVNLFASIFDLAILLIFFKNTLYTRKETIALPVFLCVSVAMESLLFINTALFSSYSQVLNTIITIFVSMLSSFVIACMYQSTFLKKIFAVISFQILAMFAEFSIAIIMSWLHPQIFDMKELTLSCIMDLSSKIILFFLSFIVPFFFNKKTRFDSLGHNLLLFTTPFITIVIMIFTPLEKIINGDNQFFFISLYICLGILNIVNYFLLYLTNKQQENTFRLHRLEDLASHQQKQYLQLSSAYKTNRRLIHDMKKHYFIIQKHIENREYDTLSEYLNISMKDLENSYSGINTGNLVIDSFVSNYKNICDDMCIQFDTDLSVDYNRIPISNYDLCVVLGNILDNAIHACKNNSTQKNHIFLSIVSKESDLFCIHMINTYNKEYVAPHKENTSIPQHGYGLKNIENIIENNYGTMNYRFGNEFDIVLVFPVIRPEQRLLNTK